MNLSANGSLPAESSVYAMPDLNTLQRKTSVHGKHVGAYAAAVLEHSLPWTKVRQVYRLLGLVRRHGADAVDDACRRALDTEVIDVGLIDRMLTRGTNGNGEQRWIWTFTDVASLDAQLDEAKIPIGALRDISEFAETDWAAQWGATRTVPDGAGGRITVPGRPWHFRGNTKPNESASATETFDTRPEPDRQPARQGEHNEEVLREFGYSDDEISNFASRGVLVHNSDTT